MDDINNTETAEETYEDINNVSFETTSLGASLSSIVGSFNPLLGNLVNIALSGVTDENLEKAIAESQSHAEFHDLVKKAQEEEAKNWRKLSAINSHTSVMIFIYNGTNETFKLSSSSWDNSSVPPEETSIDPRQYLSFILRHDTPVLSSGRTIRSTKAAHSFSYKSANHAFSFSTLLKLTKPFSAFTFTPPTVPHREHEVNSTGKIKLNCNASITRTQPEKPYSYGVVITLS